MFICSVILFILGCVLITGRGGFLIAGYNTAPKEEKEKMDEKALCKFMGKSMFALAFIMAIIDCSYIFKIYILSWVGWIAFVGIIIFILVYANTKNRFVKKNSE